MTLVEILIVLAIIGSMLAFLAPNVMDRFQKSKVKQTQIVMSQVGSAINLYSSDCGKIPSDLKQLVENPGESECADWGPKPYVKKNLLMDGWDKPIIYEVEGGAYTLKSLGKDHRPGGSAYNADITFNEDGLVTEEKK